MKKILNILIYGGIILVAWKVFHVVSLEVWYDAFIAAIIASVINLCIGVGSLLMTMALAYFGRANISIEVPFIITYAIGMVLIINPLSLYFASMMMGELFSITGGALSYFLISFFMMILGIKDGEKKNKTTSFYAR